MELLVSNYRPLKTCHHSFYDAFARTFAQADEYDIAVGYVSEDSLTQLRRMVELNNIHRLGLTIGMHYIDSFTQRQYDAAIQLNAFLKENHLGEVRLVTPFRFHGKMYLASKNNVPFAGIIGSNNLNSIIDDSDKIYEASILMEDPASIQDMHAFISQLNKEASCPIDECKNINISRHNSALDEQEGVRKVLPYEQKSFSETGVSFEIPIKTEPKSNLNAYFGKGRESKATGIVIPRHWYEAELIVPRSITSQPYYPQAQMEDAIFDVITDDGYSFKCKVSGDFSKNFRSADDLKILGRWLKGRMEEKGALNIGEPVTPEVLYKYGRDTFTLTMTNKPNLWYIDFGVR